MLLRARIERDVIEGGPQLALPAHLLIFDELQQEVELLGEQRFIVVEVIAEKL